VGWAAKDEVVCEHRRPVGPMVDGVAALEPGSSKGAGEGIGGPCGRPQGTGSWVTPGHVIRRLCADKPIRKQHQVH